MEITSRTQADATVVVLSGDLDGKTSAATQAQVLPLIPDHGKIVVDMSAVPYMSSAGLRTMLLLYRQAAAKGSKIALAGLSEDIRDTMSATGFLDFFVTADTVEAGLGRLGDGAPTP